MQSCFFIFQNFQCLYYLNETTIYKFYLSSIKTPPGNYCEEVIPDPIPNSEVKLFSADGTLP